MYEVDLELNNQQYVIKPKQTESNVFHIYV